MKMIAFQFFIPNNYRNKCLFCYLLRNPGRWASIITRVNIRINKPCYYRLLSSKSVNEITNNQIFKINELITPKYLNMVNEICAFHASYGELPKYAGARNNGFEATLANFICRSREKKRLNMIDKQLEELMEQKLLPLGFLWDPKTERRISKINAICLFYAKYGELPRSNGRRDNGHEAEMAFHMKNYRNSKIKNEISEKLETAIEEKLVPIGFKWGEKVDNFIEMINEVCDFHAKYGALPNHKGLHDDENEKRLGAFLSKLQRKVASRLSKQLEKAVDEKLVPLGFFWSPRMEKHFYHINEISTFYTCYREFPNEDGTRDDGNEEKLAFFMECYRNNKSRNTLSKPLEKMITEKLIPLGFEWKVKVDNHNTMINELCIFHAKFGEFPHNDGKYDDNENENKLSTLIQYCEHIKKPYIKWSMKLKILVEERLAPLGFIWSSEMIKPLDDLNAICSFHFKYAEFPHSEGQRDNGGEHRLADILKYYRKNKALNKLSHQVEVLVEEKLLPLGFVWDSCPQIDRNYIIELCSFHNKIVRKLDDDNAVSRNDELDPNEMAKLILDHHGTKASGDLGITISKLIRKRLIPSNFPRNRYYAHNYKSIDAIYDFHQRYGELPKYFGLRDDGNENMLALKISYLRLRRKRNKLSENIVKIVEEKLVPIGFCWSVILDDNMIVDKLIAFHTKYGIFPRDSGANRLKDEIILHKLFATYLRRTTKREKVINLIVEKLVPLGFIWNPSAKFHLKIIDGICSFHLKYGELPIVHGVRNNGREHYLARFIRLYQRGGRKKLSAFLKNVIIKRLFPLGLAWDAMPIAKVRYFDYIYEICEFYNKYGELPQVNPSFRNNKHEMVLAEALSQYRIMLEGDNDLNRYYYQLVIDKLMPKGFIWRPLTTRIIDDINSIAIFRSQHGRFPILDGMCIDKQERSLAHVIHKYQQNKINKKLSKSLENYINAKLKPLGFIWDPMFFEFSTGMFKIIEFYDKYKDIPKITGNREDGKEKKLAANLAEYRKHKKYHNLDYELSKIFRENYHLFGA